MELVPGEKWITVKCHSPACRRDIFVVSVPVEMAAQRSDHASAAVQVASTALRIRLPVTQSGQGRDLERAEVLHGGYVGVAAVRANYVEIPSTDIRWPPRYYPSAKQRVRFLVGL